MWRRGGQSAALDRAQALLSSRRNSRGAGVPTRETWQQTNAGIVSVKARSAPSNTYTLPSDVSDLSSVSSESDHGAAEKIHEHLGGPPQHLRPQSSLPGDVADEGLRGGGSRFLKKKAVPPDALGRKNSQFVSKSQLEQQQQQPVPRSSQNAALSRVADLESRIRSRKQAQHLLKSASDLRSSIPSSPPAGSPAPPSTACRAEPFGQSSLSSDEQRLKGKRFLKSNRASGVKTSQPAVPGIGPRPRDADGAEPSAGTDVRRVAGVSLESDEEDMKKLLGDSLHSPNSSLTPVRPKYDKTADEVESRHSHSVSTTPHPPAAIPTSPPSSASISTPRSPASPFRFTGHTQAHFRSSGHSTPLPPARVSPSPAESPQRRLSSMSSNSVILSLAELFPVGTQDPHSETSLASIDDFKITALTLDDLVPVKLDLTGETTDMEDQNKSAQPGPAIQQHHQKLIRQNSNQEEGPNYESDFESDSRRTEVNDHLPARDDNDEEADPVSEIMDEVSKVSRLGEEVLYSDTFSDVSSAFTSRSSDHSAESSSRTSRSCDNHLRRQDSAHKLVKDAVVQTQLAPPTYGLTAGLSVGSETFPDPTPVIAHLSAETVEAIGSFNPSAFVLTELLKQQLASTKRFIESNRHLHESLLRSLEPPNYRYTTLEDTQELIRKHRLVHRVDE